MTLIIESITNETITVSNTNEPGIHTIYTQSKWLNYISNILKLSVDIKKDRYSIFIKLIGPMDFPYHFNLGLSIIRILLYTGEYRKFRFKPKKECSQQLQDWIMCYLEDSLSVDKNDSTEIEEIASISIPTSGPLYRGTAFESLPVVGEILEFPGVTSWSKRRNIAESFVRNEAYFNAQDNNSLNEIMCLFELKEESQVYSITPTEYVPPETMLIYLVEAEQLILDGYFDVVSVDKFPQEEGYALIYHVVLKSKLVVGFGE